MEIPLRCTYLTKLHITGVPEGGATLSISGNNICDLYEGENMVDFAKMFEVIHWKEWNLSLLGDDEKPYAPEKYRVTVAELLLLVINGCPSSSDGMMSAEPDVTYTGLNVQRCQHYSAALIITPACSTIKYTLEMR
jgi:hypothetical protein